MNANALLGKDGLRLRLRLVRVASRPVLGVPLRQDRLPVRLVAHAPERVAYRLVLGVQLRTLSSEYNNKDVVFSPAFIKSGAGIKGS